MSSYDYEGPYNLFTAPFLQGRYRVEMEQAEENRTKRRDKKTYQRKYGMRVVGQSVKNLADILRRKNDVHKQG